MSCGCLARTVRANMLMLCLIAAGTPALGQSTLPACRVGLHVPIVSPLNYSAVILEADAAKGSYKVKSDADGLTDWVTASKLRYSCVGAEATAITESYFVGDWSLFVGPTPNREMIDGKGYLVVGPGAHVPPLRINADHTYIWVIDSKTTVRGTWRSMTASELRANTKLPAILLMKGESGANWEVSRKGVNAGNNHDTIDIDRMDLGLSAVGTRLAK